MTHAREITMALGGRHTQRPTDGSYLVSYPVPSTPHLSSASPDRKPSACSMPSSAG
jgi:hypothetical protein